MELDEDMDILVIPRKIALALLVVVNLFIVTALVVDYVFYGFEYVGLIIIIFSPIIMVEFAFVVGTLFRKLGSLLLFLIKPCVSLFQSLGKHTREHLSRHKELEPMSSYDSLQARAKGFLKLAIPTDIKLEKYSFANKCIKTYAKNGEVSLTEKERAELSLVILETGISSQEPGDKSYYERERVAILENILSEFESS